MNLSQISAKAVISSMIAAELCVPAFGAKLVEVRTVDDEHLMVHWLDGEVRVQRRRQGPRPPSKATPTAAAISTATSPAIDTTAAAAGDSYTLTSADDPAYAHPTRPPAAFRKTKVNGTDKKWPEPELHPRAHNLPQAPPEAPAGQALHPRHRPGHQQRHPLARIHLRHLQQRLRSHPRQHHRLQPRPHRMKSADLYMWLGDGGGRDYSSYAGRKVILLNVETGAEAAMPAPSPSGRRAAATTATGTSPGPMSGTATSPPSPARASIASSIEGVGCSPEFQISRDIYLRTL